MDSKSDLGRYNAILNDVANVLFSAAQADAGSRPWKEGNLIICSAGTGGARLEKWRLELADGQLLKELDVPVRPSLLTRLFAIRDEASTDKKWYAILISVFPDERSEVKFDYDPNCVKDFFKS